jgi:serine/threonine protein kinase/tetratricopeptide (TPR) repeat protein
VTFSVAQNPLMAGRFLIEREVGRGGVGIVYRAKDEVTGQAVALKVIAISGVDAGEEARFIREGRLLAGLTHPGIVRLVAFGQLEDGPPYVAMEWLEGEDLAQRQKRKPLRLVQTLEVMATIADALGASHEAGIVHRDVKPSNVFLLKSEDDAATPAAKLVDFGVASAEDAKLTRTGAIIGTPAYMAPEQARGDTEVDFRADLYGLGATLFEMVAGRPPHVGPTPIAILARLVTTPAPRLCEVVPEAPASLDDLMARLLATSPPERPSGGAEVARELRRIAREVATSTDIVRGVPEQEPPHSFGSGVTTSRNSGGTRMVTSILATQVPKGASRQRLLAHLRSRGADATELGGDAIVAHLGARRALGDEAARAIDIAFRLAKSNASVGIATGRTRVDRTRPTGEVVDRAAALAHTAARGQVLADTTTSELARGRFEFQIRSDGSAVVGAEVRGKRDQVGGAPFVGRENELGQVTAAFERCLEDKTPVVTTVTGAPGIGKTRLRRESVSRIASYPSNPRIVLARCETFAKSHALGIVAEIARGLVGVPKGTGLEEASGATAQFADARRIPVTPAARELVARLIANEPLPHTDDPRGTRDALWIALTDLAVGRAREAPLAIVIEDAQWADAESLAWLDHVLGRGGGRPLFVLLTARPTMWRDDPKRFAGRDHVRIELRPLARKTVRAIARAMLGDRATGDAGEQLTDFIAQQAAGSPLFAEELARLAAKGQDATSAPTIEAAIQVHLDALEDASRDAAIKLSVFGMVGWDAGLAALGVPNAGEALRQLASSEILFEQATSRFKDTREWSFKHALMREVAYASIGEDSLRAMHAKVGQWLAKMGEDDATVARHLDLGGETLVAAGFLEKAARRALAANALGEAVAMAERSLAFAEDKPSQFARAQLLDEAWNRQDARAGERASAVRAMEEAVYDQASDIRARGARVRYEDACGGGPDTSAKLEAVRKDAQAAGLADEEVRDAAALAARYAYAGEPDRAEEVADHLLSIAQKYGIPGAEVEAWSTLAMVRQARGQVGAALEARRSAARAASEAGLKTREAHITINLGFALTTVGAKNEARLAIESGITLAQAIGSPGTVRHGQMNLLCWSSSFGADSAHDALLAEPRATADAAIGGSWVPHDRASLGALYYRGTELLLSEASRLDDRARTLLRIAAQGYRATKMLDVLPVALGFWAEAERRRGQPDRARELAKEAATMMEEGHPSLLNEAPVYLALHDACMDLSMPAEAKDAIARGVPRLVTRVHGLAGTPYARGFLTQLAPNAGLMAAAGTLGLVPEELVALVEKKG